jgi:hypothetical protein
MNKTTVSIFVGLGLVTAYLKTPRSAGELGPDIYHGTNVKRMLPDAKVGAVFKVKKHFFFTNSPHLAKNYAQGLGFSAFRPGESTNADPVVLRVALVDSSVSVWKKGWFGGQPYFPEGTMLVIQEIQYPPKISPEQRKQIDNSRFC